MLKISLSLFTGYLLRSCRADLCNATRWQSVPVFPLVSFPRLPSLTQFMPSTAPDSQLCLYDPIISIAILSGHSDLLTLLQDLHTIAMFLDFANPKNTAILQNTAYVDHVYLAEHKGLMLMAQYKTSPPIFLPVDMNPKETLIIPLLLQALMLYIYTNIRLTPVSGSIRSTLVCRIQLSVAEMPVPMLDVLFEAFPHEVFWIMFLAGSSSVENNQKIYFVGHLKWMCENLALECWGDIEDKLGRFLWLHEQFLHRCKALWSDVVSYVPDDEDWNMIG